MNVTGFLSLIAALVLIGCSKENNSSEGPKRIGRSYVPPEAAQIVSSSDFKLEHTTKSGIQCFVCPVTSEIAQSISSDSSDYQFLVGGKKPILLVPIREGKIIELNPQEAAEVAEFSSKISGATKK